jgi:hypothetical protein
MEKNSEFSRKNFYDSEKWHCMEKNSEFSRKNFYDSEKWRCIEKFRNSQGKISITERIGVS